MTELLAVTEEAALARILDSLDASWSRLHRGAAHLLVGPAGVFSVTIVNHPGQDLWIDDFTLAIGLNRTHAVDRARREARELSGALAHSSHGAPRVTPILVVLDAGEITLAPDAGKIVVVRGDRLVRWLSQRPAVLSRVEVADVADHAQRAMSESGVGFASDADIDFEAEFSSLADRLMRGRNRLLLALELSAAAAFVAAIAVIQF